MKKIIIAMVAVLFTFTSVGVCLAGAKANERKGKYTYRKVYKACHKRGEVASAKPILSPDAKTQAQWDRVFEKKDFDQFKCKEEWSKLSEQDLADIHAYLHAHAADSPSPAKCK